MANMTGTRLHSRYRPKSRCVIWPIIMFCGLPIKVAPAPMLLAMVSAIKKGTGLICLRSSAAPVIGANA